MKDKIKNMVIFGLVISNMATITAIEEPAGTQEQLSEAEFTSIIEDITNGGLEVKEAGKTDRGSYYVDLSDGSYVVYNVNTKKVHFQPVELGDWDYTLELADAKKCIATYSELKSN